MGHRGAVGPVAGPGYKTQPCRNMKDTGHCDYGPACQFAHSMQEMTAARGNGGGGGGSSRGGGGGRDSRGGAAGKPVKVVLCQQHSQSGNCERGDDCQFAHGLEELQAHRTRQVPNYKTTLCQPWTSTGQCSYGDTCMYAHGREELRVQQGGIVMNQYQDNNKDSNMIHRRVAGGEGVGVQPDSKRFRM
eukprot:GFUD01041804.1.p1 GENE.GFUD01041804.1~~GFUD01041804.1.p1  ORF type:complete len:201 (+),score=67.80 GFUD01041804.1:37-603(+)